MDSQHPSYRRGLFFVLVFFLPLCVNGQNPGQNWGDIFRSMEQMEQSFDSVFSEISPEEAYYIGRSVGAQLLAVYKPYNNPSLTAYVNKICGAIVINSPQPVLFGGYHVIILDTMEINALATPGGHIFISRGLVEAAVSEDTLAAVIAHEIAHIQLKHGLASIEFGRFNQSLNEAAQAGAAMTGRNFSQEQERVLFGQSIADVVNTLTKSGYSHAQEFEADTMALSLLAGAGYEPSSLIELLRILGRVQPGRPGGFNVTHPSPTQRILNAEQPVRSYRVRDTRSFRAGRFQSK